MHIFGNPTTKHAELPALYPSLKLWVDTHPSYFMPAATNSGVFPFLLNRANRNVPNFGISSGCKVTFNAFRGSIPAIIFTTNTASFDFINPTLTFGNNSTLMACCIPSNAGDNAVFRTSSANRAYIGINSSLQAYVGDNNSVVLTSSGTVSNGAICTIAATVVSSVSTSLYINGNKDSVGAGAAWATNQIDTVGGELGAINNISLAECIYFNDALSDQDIYLLHKYLYSKWF